MWTILRPLTVTKDTTCTRRLTSILASSGLHGLEFDDVSHLVWYSPEDESTPEGAERKKLVNARMQSTATAARLRLAAVQNSDAHSVAQLTAKRILTRFKMNELGFEGLRTALVDPEARVRAIATIPPAFPRILGMHTSGGFLSPRSAATALQISVPWRRAGTSGMPTTARAIFQGGVMGERSFRDVPIQNSLASQRSASAARTSRSISTLWIGPPLNNIFHLRALRMSGRFLSSLIMYVIVSAVMKHSRVRVSPRNSLAIPARADASCWNFDVTTNAAMTSPPPFCRSFCLLTYSTRARKDGQLASNSVPVALASMTMTLKSGSGATISLTFLPRLCAPNRFTLRPKQNSSPSATRSSNSRHGSPDMPAGNSFFDATSRCCPNSCVSTRQAGTAPPIASRNSFQLNWPLLPT